MKPPVIFDDDDGFVDKVLRTNRYCLDDEISSNRVPFNCNVLKNREMFDIGDEKMTLATLFSSKETIGATKRLI